MNIKEVAINIARLLFSRWRFLSLYLLFAGIALNGCYIDIVGWFSSSEDYAASIKAQYGDINILNVLVFITGSVVFLGYLWADVKNKRLEKMITGDISIKNTSFLGDASQAVATAESSQAINAPQGQITINNIAGITEERCNTIFDERLPVALQDYSVETIYVAKDRTYKFRQKLVPRLGKEEKGFESFADPSFLLLLIEAQKAAASTDREADYDVLSELLAQRAKMGTDRSLHIGIHKAVDILPFISDSQLAGMTIQFCFIHIASSSNSIIETLSLLNEAYGKIIGEVDLPTGMDWLESLEAGGLVKNVNSSLHHYMVSKDILLSTMGRFTATGIVKDSDNYIQAVNILKEVGLPDSIFLEHELNDHFVRLLPMNVHDIDNIRINRVRDGVTTSSMLTETQKDGLKRIFDLYVGDYMIVEDFKNRFVAKYNEYPNLKKITTWWDANTKMFFEQTIVGKILSNANANKCDARIPIIIK